MIWMNTWGILNRTNNMTRSCFSSFLYTCIVFTFFFYFKENTIATTDKQRAKQIQQKKNIQKCGGQVASNSIWLCPSNKTKFSLFFSLFFFHLFWNYICILFPLQLKGGNLLILSHICFTSFFFFFFYRRTKVSPLRLWYGYTNFKQICFPPKLAANEQPQNVSLE